MKRIVIAVLLVLFTCAPVMAKTTIELPATLTQEEFKAFSKDFGMALSYIPLAAAAPLGDKLPGFDLGVEASYVKLDKNTSWYQKIDAAGDLPEAVVVPRVHLQVGLPFIPIDLGVSYASVPNSDIKLAGYELKYAILKGGTATPALAIRGAYTKLSGVDQLDLSTKSLDLSISKGILIFTPYAGVGQVWITSEPNSGFAPALEKEDISETKFFVGTKIKIFPFINMVLEGDFANVNVYSARLNVNF
jgi:hypothetical protein